MDETRPNETQEVDGEEGRKIKWTTIKMPVELRDKINELAEKMEKPAWKIVMNAISFFDEQLRNPRLKERLPVVDKISWYIVKISMSVAEFKVNPTDENFARLIRTAEQIKERLGIDTDLLLRAAEAYKKEPNTDNRMELNAALKMLVFEMIMEKLIEVK